ncbi:MAG TPA: heme exporter protein CcmB [Chthonomonadales bacterium]|nr:heme exporter protein CcmB [Chthonomonadales bacterium]
MPDGSAPSVLAQALAVFRKDLDAELRSRTAVTAVLLFSVTSLAVVGFAKGAVAIPEPVQAALLWVVLFFAAFAGLANVWLHEEDRGTSAILRMHAAPEAIYTGKLLLNLLLLAAVALVVTPLYLAMMDVSVGRPGALALVVGTAGFGLAAGATVVGAMIARASARSSLYGAVGFPVLLPLLMMAAHATALALRPAAPASDIWGALTGIAAFGVAIVAASWIVFAYIWEDA